MNKTEEIKHVTIRNNKTLKDGQPSPTNNNQKLVVNDTSNISNSMNEWYYNNSTKNITSTNHSAGLQIGRDECVSVGNNLHDSTSDSYKKLTTTITTTILLGLTKIMTTIWQKKIK